MALLFSVLHSLTSPCWPVTALTCQHIRTISWFLLSLLLLQNLLLAWLYHAASVIPVC